MDAHNFLGHSTKLTKAFLNYIGLRRTLQHCFFINVLGSVLLNNHFNFFLGEDSSKINAKVGLNKGQEVKNLGSNKRMVDSNEALFSASSSSVASSANSLSLRISIGAISWTIIIFHVAALIKNVKIKC